MTVSNWPHSPMIPYIERAQDHLGLSLSALADVIGYKYTHMLGVVAGTRRLPLRATLKLYALMGQDVGAATAAYLDQPTIPADKKRTGKPRGRPKKNITLI